MSPRFLAAMVVLAGVGTPAVGQTVLVEAEQFENPGGWVRDAQFMDEMGSPYLLAHGLGVPVEDAATEPDDVEYILGLVNRYFPDARLAPADVLATWAGLRPLIDTGRGGPSDISRRHEIRMPEPGWLDVAGGKLTTHRLIAEQAIDRVFRSLGRRSPPCRTADEPLLEGQEDDGLSGILPPPVSAEAVEHTCRGEWAVHLDDVMIRRTSWHYYLDDADQVADQAARWMAEIFAWDDSRREAELARYRGQLH